MEEDIKPLDMEEYQRKTCTWSLDGPKYHDPHLHTQVY